jgi:recombination protein RecR
MEIPSKLIADAVAEFSRLPGIGKKTALRMVLYLLQRPKEEVSLFSHSIKKMRDEISYCATCHNVSDNQYCHICSNLSRDQHTICVVENFRDVIAIENTQQYRGLYHLLGGVISPVDGIGPDKLNIESLMTRIEQAQVQGHHAVREIIMALNPTIEGDTTIFYITKKLRELPVKITTISRGVAFGGELEYVDELTLGRSINSRLPYENYLVQQKL